MKDMPFTSQRAVGGLHIRLTADHDCARRCCIVSSTYLDAAALAMADWKMTVTVLRMWEAPHLLTMASGSEATLKYFKVGERIWWGFPVFADDEGSETEGES